jgi:hypothetical protein
MAQQVIGAERLRVTSRAPAVANPTTASLESASLRGPDALLDSSLPSLPRALRRHVQRGPFL